MVQGCIGSVKKNRENLTSIQMCTKLTIIHSSCPLKKIIYVAYMYICNIYVTYSTGQKYGLTFFRFLKLL